MRINRRAARKCAREKETEMSTTTEIAERLKGLREMMDFSVAEMAAVAGQGQSSRIDSLDCSNCIAFNAGDLHLSGNGVTR